MFASDCSICLESYEADGRRTPRTLKECGHTFCEACIANIVRDNTVVGCVTCRVETPLPASGVKGLHKAFALLEYLEQVKANRAQSTESKSPPCSCGEANVTVSCTQCGTSLCADCDSIFHGRGDRKTHVRTGWVREVPVPKCSVHPNYPLDLVCQQEDCSPPNALICLLCRDYGAHVGHKAALLQEVANKMRQDLAAQLKALTSSGDKVAAATTQVVDVLEEVRGITTAKPAAAVAASLSGSALSHHAAVQFVRSEFQELHNLLSEREQEVLTQVTLLQRLKCERLEAQLLSLQSFLSNFFSATDQARALLLERNDQQFMCSARSSFAALNQVEEMPDLKLAASPSYEVRWNSNARRAIQTHLEVGEVVKNLDLGDLVVGSGISVALDPDRVHNYNNVIVQSGGVLTVIRAGRLLLIACTIIIEDNGFIEVDGKGFKGGKNSRKLGQAQQGASTVGLGVEHSGPNGGGGGGGTQSKSWGSTGGGGGGYGECGFEADPNVYSGGSHPGGQGGLAYGDSSVSGLWLGSGGGAGAQHGELQECGNGGAGGGAIYLRAQVLCNQGVISANGLKGTDGIRYGSGGGGGSGGSIWIQAASLTQIGTVRAVGGARGAAGIADLRITSDGGSGGNGRIRVDYDESPAFNATKPLHGMQSTFTGATSYEGLTAAVGGGISRPYEAPQMSTRLQADPKQEMPPKRAKTE